MFQAAGEASDVKDRLRKIAEEVIKARLKNEKFDSTHRYPLHVKLEWEECVSCFWSTEWKTKQEWINTGVGIEGFYKKISQYEESKLKYRNDKKKKASEIAFKKKNCPQNKAK